MPLNGAAPLVLVGFAEALAAPETAWSLADAGFAVAAFHRAGSRPALGRDHRVALHPVTAPEDDARAAVAEVAELAARLGAAAVMPLDDGSVWVVAEAAPELPCPVIGPTGAQAHLALDKTRQLDAATAAGLRVPPSVVCHAPDDVLALDGLPLVVKPALAAVERDGRLARGSAATCADAAGLQAVARAWDDTGPRIAQPLLGGTGEGLFGLASGGRAGAWSAHRRLRMLNPAGSGASACAAAPVDPELAAGGERLLSAAGWRGLAMLEFLRDGDGVPWFMELNGRPWGSLALARRRGLEYPAWAAAEVLGLPFDGATEAGDGQALVCRHLGRELVHLMAVLRGPRGPVASWPSRRATVRAMLQGSRAECWYNWRRQAPGVFVQDTVDTLRQALGRAAAR